MKVPAGVRPNPNAVSRALMLGLTGIVFLTLVTVIVNELPFHPLTVNVAVASRLVPDLSPSQVTVNVVFPFTKTLTSAKPGTAEARISENTKTVTRRTFVNIPMRLLASVQHHAKLRQRCDAPRFRQIAAFGARR